MWKGWTRVGDADAYNQYLNTELFPRVERELTAYGYRGYHILRLDRGTEVEFVTMVWFDSLESVKSFAGESYDTPVISDKARALLSRHVARCDHYELAGYQLRVA